jgi:DUF4097 and DUF4098 domain-containing protein YvlB
MERSFATSGNVLVTVDNEVGLVSITGSETDSTTVSIEADTPGAEELVERATVECRQSGGRDHIVVKIPRMHGMKFIRRNGVTIRIDMPRGGDVGVSTASADVELNGTLGDTEVKTCSGDITADDTDELRAKSASGDISVGTVEGELRMHSASGDLRVNRVDGRASVTTTSGDVEVGAAADRIDMRSTSGNLRLGDLDGDASLVAVSGDVRVLSCSAGRVQVRSVSGDISIGIAEGVNLRVDAQSMSGRVSSDIPLGDVPSPKKGAREVVLAARNVSGDVLVERAVEAYAS